MSGLFQNTGHLVHIIADFSVFYKTASAGILIHDASDKLGNLFKLLFVVPIRISQDQAFFQSFIF
ncbi:hypothetical protein SDC9_129334 [bioreactor metagenome]|uniref:Uncharacterized protein n=1 Tax=bioreactor metagenome TaxID=1076179 RepID=A0A645CZI4_9ZZZZ